ncbi:organic cation transporter protein, partial [Plakobranchus ocellatus]
FCVNLLYYGLSLHLYHLPGNTYLNFFIGSVVELAAYIIAYLILDRIGRKTVHLATMFASGIACLVVIVPVLFLPSEYSGLITVLAMIGKTTSSICYATLYIMTAELLPTVVRSSGFAFCSIFESFSAMTSPYIADLGRLMGGHLSQALPMIVFGSAALLAGILSIQLPETLGRDLPETIHDALVYERFVFIKMIISPVQLCLSPCTLENFLG